MKKKLLTIALSMVLCLGSTMTVMANPSSTKTSGASMNVNGQNFEVQQDQWSAYYATASENEIKALDSYYEVVGAGIDSNMSEEEMAAAYEKNYIAFVKAQTGIEVASMPVHYMTEIPLPAGLTEADLAGGVAITFTAYGISAGDNIVVLHLKKDGTWEQISATAGDGVITGTFTSLSPVFYAKVGSAAVDENHYHQYSEFVVAPTATTWGYTTHYCACGDTYYDNYVAPTSGSAAAVTSPKTAENEMPVAVLFVAFAAAGAAVCVRRKVNA